MNVQEGLINPNNINSNLVDNSNNNSNNNLNNNSNNRAYNNSNISNFFKGNNIQERNSNKLNSKEFLCNEQGKELCKDVKGCKWDNINKECNELKVEFLRRKFFRRF